MKLRARHHGGSVRNVISLFTSGRHAPLMCPPLSTSWPVQGLTSKGPRRNLLTRGLTVEVTGTGSRPNLLASPVGRLACRRAALADDRWPHVILSAGSFPDKCQKWSCLRVFGHEVWTGGQRPGAGQWPRVPRDHCHWFIHDSPESATIVPCVLRAFPILGRASQSRGLASSKHSTEANGSPSAPSLKITYILPLITSPFVNENNKINNANPTILPPVHSAI